MSENAGGAHQLSTVITYMEMLAPPQRLLVAPPPHLKLALLRAEKPTISFSRYLYDTVGREWWWWERKRLDDAELAAITRHPSYETYVLYVGGVPAGYFELDRRETGVAELA